MRYLSWGGRCLFGHDRLVWGRPRQENSAEWGRTAWRLFNGFTEVIKGRNLAVLPKRTQVLHGLMDSACGIAV